MNRLLLVIGLILIIIGSIGATTYWQSYRDVSHIEGEESFSVDEIKRLDIRSSVAKIEVLPSTSEDFSIKYQIPERMIDKVGEPDIRVKDGTLKVSLPYKTKGKFLSFLRKENRSLAVKVYVPKNHLLTEVVATSNVGMIVLKDQEIPSVDVSSNVAQIKLENLQAETIDVRSDVGSIVLTNFTGRVNAENEVGEVRLQTDELTDDVNAKTEIGEISLTLSNQPENANIRGNSQVGDVSIFGSKADYILPDAEHDVDLKSEVGSVKVKILNK